MDRGLGQGVPPESEFSVTAALGTLGRRDRQQHLPVGLDGRRRRTADGPSHGRIEGGRQGVPQGARGAAACARHQIHPAFFFAPLFLLLCFRPSPLSVCVPLYAVRTGVQQCPLFYLFLSAFLFASFSWQGAQGGGRARARWICRDGVGSCWSFFALVHADLLPAAAPNRLRSLPCLLLPSRRWRCLVHPLGVFRWRGAAGSDRWDQKKKNNQATCESFLIFDFKKAWRSAGMSDS
nr:hypothetical protein [Pandoravirus belohorizontensis]